MAQRTPRRAVWVNRQVFQGHYLLVEAEVYLLSYVLRTHSQRHAPSIFAPYLSAASSANNQPQSMPSDGTTSESRGKRNNLRTISRIFIFLNLFSSAAVVTAFTVHCAFPFAFLFRSALIFRFHSSHFQPVDRDPVSFLFVLRVLWRMFSDAAISQSGPSFFLSQQ